MDKRQFKNIFLTAAFLIICCAAPAVGAIYHRVCGYGESEENRQLAAFPGIDKIEDIESFPDQFTSWFSDHLFLKAQMVEAKSELEAAAFHELDSDKVILGSDKWIFNRSDDGQPLETYKRTNLFTEEELDEVSANLLDLRRDIEDCGIRFVLMISPDKEQIYGEDHIPGYIRVSDNAGITRQLIDRLMAEDPEYRIVYPAEALKAAKADVDVYYSSDTHWNKIGAQIACRELVRVICEEEAVTEPAGAFVTVDKELVSDTKFIVGGEKRGDLQKLAKLGKAYNSTEYEPEQPLKRNLISEERDRNDEAVWEHYNSTDDGAIDAKVYLTGDSFRWNMASFLEEAVSDTVVTSRYYLDTDDLLNEEPEVFVYMIAERYLHDLAMIPGYNTAALVNTN